MSRISSAARVEPEHTDPSLAGPLKPTPSEDEEIKHQGADARDRHPRLQASLSGRRSGKPRHDKEAAPARRVKDSLRESLNLPSFLRDDASDEELEDPRAAPVKVPRAPAKDIKTNKETNHTDTPADTAATGHMTDTLFGAEPVAIAAEPVASPAAPDGAQDSTAAASAPAATVADAASEGTEASAPTAAKASKAAAPPNKSAQTDKNITAEKDQTGAHSPSRQQDDEKSHMDIPSALSAMAHTVADTVAGSLRSVRDNVVEAAEDALEAVGEVVQSISGGPNSDTDAITDKDATDAAATTKPQETQTAEQPQQEENAEGARSPYLDALDNTVPPLASDAESDAQTPASAAASMPKPVAEAAHKQVAKDKSAKKTSPDQKNAQAPAAQTAQPLDEQKEGMRDRAGQRTPQDENIAKEKAAPSAAPVPPAAPAAERPAKASVAREAAPQESMAAKAVEAPVTVPEELAAGHGAGAGVGSSAEGFLRGVRIEDVHNGGFLSLHRKDPFPTDIVEADVHHHTDYIEAAPRAPVIAAAPAALVAAAAVPVAVLPVAGPLPPAARSTEREEDLFADWGPDTDADMRAFIAAHLPDMDIARGQAVPEPLPAREEVAAATMPRTMLAPGTSMSPALNWQMQEEVPGMAAFISEHVAPAEEQVEREMDAWVATHTLPERMAETREVSAAQVQREEQEQEAEMGEWVRHHMEGVSQSDGTLREEPRSMWLPPLQTAFAPINAVTRTGLYGAPIAASGNGATTLRPSEVVRALAADVEVPPTRVDHRATVGADLAPAGLATIEGVDHGTGAAALQAPLVAVAPDAAPATSTSTTAEAAGPMPWVAAPPPAVVAPLSPVRAALEELESEADIRNFINAHAHVQSTQAEAGEGKTPEVEGIGGFIKAHTTPEVYRALADKTHAATPRTPEEFDADVRDIVLERMPERVLRKALVHATPAPLADAAATAPSSIVALSPSTLAVPAFSQTPPHASATAEASDDAALARGGRTMTALGVEAWGEEARDWEEASAAANTASSPTFFVRSPQRTQLDTEFRQRTASQLTRAQAGTTGSAEVETGRVAVVQGGLDSPVHGRADVDAVEDEARTVCGSSDLGSGTSNALANRTGAGTDWDAQAPTTGTPTSATSATKQGKSEQLLSTAPTLTQTYTRTRTQVQAPAETETKRITPGSGTSVESGAASASRIQSGPVSARESPWVWDEVADTLVHLPDRQVMIEVPSLTTFPLPPAPAPLYAVRLWAPPRAAKEELAPVFDLPGAAAYTATPAGSSASVPLTLPLNSASPTAHSAIRESTYTFALPALSNEEAADRRAAALALMLAAHVPPPREGYGSPNYGSVAVAEDMEGGEAVRDRDAALTASPRSSATSWTTLYTPPGVHARIVSQSASMLPFNHPALSVSQYGPDTTTSPSSESAVSSPEHLAHRPSLLSPAAWPGLLPGGHSAAAAFTSDLLNTLENAFRGRRRSAVSQTRAEAEMDTMTEARAEAGERRMSTRDGSHAGAEEGEGEAAWPDSAVGAALKIHGAPPRSAAEALNEAIEARQRAKARESSEEALARWEREGLLRTGDIVRREGGTVRYDLGRVGEVDQLRADDEELWLAARERARERRREAAVGTGRPPWERPEVNVAGGLAQRGELGSGVGASWGEVPGMASVCEDVLSATEGATPLRPMSAFDEALRFQRDHTQRALATLSDKAARVADAASSLADKLAADSAAATSAARTSLAAVYAHAPAVATDVNAAVAGTVAVAQPPTATAPQPSGRGIMYASGAAARNAQPVPGVFTAREAEERREKRTARNGVDAGRAAGDRAINLVSDTSRPFGLSFFFTPTPTTTAAADIAPADVDAGVLPVTTSSSSFSLGSKRKASAAPRATTAGGGSGDGDGNDGDKAELTLPSRAELSGFNYTSHLYTHTPARSASGDTATQTHDVRGGVSGLRDEMRESAAPDDLTAFAATLLAATPALTGDDEEDALILDVAQEILRPRKKAISPTKPTEERSGAERHVHGALPRSLSLPMPMSMASVSLLPAQALAQVDERVPLAALSYTHPVDAHTRALRMDSAIAGANEKAEDERPRFLLAHPPPGLLADVPPPRPYYPLVRDVWAARERQIAAEDVLAHHRSHHAHNHAHNHAERSGSAAVPSTAPYSTSYSAPVACADDDMPTPEWLWANRDQQRSLSAPSRGSYRDAWSYQPQGSRVEYDRLRAGQSLERASAHGVQREDEAAHDVERMLLGGRPRHEQGRDRDPWEDGTTHTATDTARTEDSSTEEDAEADATLTAHCDDPLLHRLLGGLRVHHTQHQGYLADKLGRLRDGAVAALAGRHMAEDSAAARACIEEDPCVQQPASQWGRGAVGAGGGSSVMSVYGSLAPSSSTHARYSPLREGRGAWSSAYGTSLYTPADEIAAASAYANTHDAHTDAREIHRPRGYSSDNYRQDYGLTSPRAYRDRDSGSVGNPASGDAFAPADTHVYQHQPHSAHAHLAPMALQSSVVPMARGDISEFVHEVGTVAKTLAEVMDSAEGKHSADTRIERKRDEESKDQKPSLLDMGLSALGQLLVPSPNQDKAGDGTLRTETVLDEALPPQSPMQGRRYKKLLRDKDGNIVGAEEGMYAFGGSEGSSDAFNTGTGSSGGGGSTLGHILKDLFRRRSGGIELEEDSPPEISQDVVNRVLDEVHGGRVEDKKRVLQLLDRFTKEEREDSHARREHKPSVVERLLPHRGRDRERGHDPDDVATLWRILTEGQRRPRTVEVEVDVPPELIVAPGLGLPIGGGVPVADALLGALAYALMQRDKNAGDFDPPAGVRWEENLSQRGHRVDEPLRLPAPVSPRDSGALEDIRSNLTAIQRGFQRSRDALARGASGSGDGNVIDITDAKVERAAMLSAADAEQINPAEEAALTPLYSVRNSLRTIFGPSTSALLLPGGTVSAGIGGGSGLVAPMSIFNSFASVFFSPTEPTSLTQSHALPGAEEASAQAALPSLQHTLLGAGGASSACFSVDHTLYTTSRLNHPMPHHGPVHTLFNAADVLTPLLPPLHHSVLPFPIPAPASPGSSSSSSSSSSSATYSYSAPVPQLAYSTLDVEPILYDTMSGVAESVERALKGSAKEQRPFSTPAIAAAEEATTSEDGTLFGAVKGIKRDFSAGAGGFPGKSLPEPVVPYAELPPPATETATKRKGHSPTLELVKEMITSGGRPVDAPRLSPQLTRKDGREPSDTELADAKIASDAANLRPSNQERGVPMRGLPKEERERREREKKAREEREQERERTKAKSLKAYWERMKQAMGMADEAKEDKHGHIHDQAADKGKASWTATSGGVDPHTKHHGLLKENAVPQHSLSHPISAYGVGYDEQGRIVYDPSRPTLQRPPKGSKHSAAELYNQIISPTLEVEVPGAGKRPLSELGAPYVPLPLSAKESVPLKQPAAKLEAKPTPVAALASDKLKVPTSPSTDKSTPSTDVKGKTEGLLASLASLLAPAAPEAPVARTEAPAAATSVTATPAGTPLLGVKAPAPAPSRVPAPMQPSGPAVPVRERNVENKGGPGSSTSAAGDKGAAIRAHGQHVSGVHAGEAGIGEGLLFDVARVVGDQAVDYGAQMMSTTTPSAAPTLVPAEKAPPTTLKFPTKPVEHIPNTMGGAANATAAAIAGYDTVIGGIQQRPGHPGWKHMVYQPPSPEPAPSSVMAAPLKPTRSLFLKEPEVQVHNPLGQHTIPLASVVFGADGKPIHSLRDVGMAYTGVLHEAEKAGGKQAEKLRRSRNNPHIYAVTMSPSALQEYVQTEYHAPSVTNLSLPPLPHHTILHPTPLRVMPPPADHHGHGHERRPGKDTPAGDAAYNGPAGADAPGFSPTMAALGSGHPFDVTNTAHFTCPEDHRSLTSAQLAQAIAHPPASAATLVSKQSAALPTPDPTPQTSPTGTHVRVRLPPDTIAPDWASEVNMAGFHTPAEQRMRQTKIAFEEARQMAEEMRMIKDKERRKVKLEAEQAKAKERAEKTHHKADSKAIVIKPAATTSESTASSTPSTAKVGATPACPPTPPGQPHVHPHKGAPEGIQLAQPYKRHYWDESGYHQNSPTSMQASMRSLLAPLLGSADERNDTRSTASSSEPKPTRPDSFAVMIRGEHNDGSAKRNAGDQHTQRAREPSPEEQRAERARLERAVREEASARRSRLSPEQVEGIRGAVRSYMYAQGRDESQATSHGLRGMGGDGGKDSPYAVPTPETLNKLPESPEAFSDITQGRASSGRGSDAHESGLMKSLTKLGESISHMVGLDKPTATTNTHQAAVPLPLSPTTGAHDAHNYSARQRVGELISTAAAEVPAHQVQQGQEKSHKGLAERKNDKHASTGARGPLANLLSDAEERRREHPLIDNIAEAVHDLTRTITRPSKERGEHAHADAHADKRTDHSGQRKDTDGELPSREVRALTQKRVLQPIVGDDIARANSGRKAGDVAKSPDSQNIASAVDALRQQLKPGASSSASGSGPQQQQRTRQFTSLLDELGERLGDVVVATQTHPADDTKDVERKHEREHFHPERQQHSQQQESKEGHQHGHNHDHSHGHQHHAHEHDQHRKLPHEEHPEDFVKMRYHNHDVYVPKMKYIPFVPPPQRHKLHDPLSMYIDSMQDQIYANGVPPREYRIENDISFKNWGNPKYARAERMARQRLADSLYSGVGPEPTNKHTSEVPMALHSAEVDAAYLHVAGQHLGDSGRGSWAYGAGPRVQEHRNVAAKTVAGVQDAAAQSVHAVANAGASAVREASRQGQKAVREVAGDSNYNVNLALQREASARGATDRDEIARLKRHAMHTVATNAKMDLPSDSGVSARVGDALVLPVQRAEDQALQRADEESERKAEEEGRASAQEQERQQQLWWQRMGAEEQHELLRRAAQHEHEDARRREWAERQYQDYLHQEQDRQRQSASTAAPANDDHRAVAATRVAQMGRPSDEPPRVHGTLTDPLHGQAGSNTLYAPAQGHDTHPHAPDAVERAVESLVKHHKTSMGLWEILSHWLTGDRKRDVAPVDAASAVATQPVPRTAEEREMAEAAARLREGVRNAERVSLSSMAEVFTCRVRPDAGAARRGGTADYAVYDAQTWRAGSDTDTEFSDDDANLTDEDSD